MVANGRHRSTVAWLGALLLVGCTGSETPDNTPESQDWVVGDAATAGFDVEALDRLGQDIEAGEFPNTHAVLVEHDGVLIYERYFSGSDERWGSPIPERVMGPDSLHDLRSISKSVTSALLGIALATDFEAALARPVVEYLPELDVGAEHREITLHHMLTMTPGLEWNEMTVPYTDPTNDEIRLYGAADPAAEVLSRPVVHRPGETWYYSGGSTQVLATIITQLTGQTIDSFAREQLFEPLGISDFEWLGPDGWSPDNPAAMSGLRLTARDLAKLGSIFLHGGRWRGQQIVPAEWVSRSSERHVPEIGDWSSRGMWGYGYQWWVGDFPSGQRVVAGVGNGNQRLFVVPSEKLTVTVFAGQYNAFGPHSERILDRVLASRQ
jgi:CubicO group peptidase (beta-lactamase class C family)